jgi:hypothetical protein
MNATYVEFGWISQIDFPLCSARGSLRSGTTYGLNLGCAPVGPSCLVMSPGVTFSYLVKTLSMGHKKSVMEKRHISS